MNERMNEYPTPIFPRSESSEAYSTLQSSLTDEVLPTVVISLMHSPSFPFLVSVLRSLIHVYWDGVQIIYFYLNLCLRIYFWGNTN